MRKRALSAALVMALLSSGAATLPEDPLARSALAERLYNTGYLLTLVGRYEEAIRYFHKSIEVEPTAEAYTYLGWTYGQMGDYARAIAEAEKAIHIDPEFGNPYNDIGVYLIEQGKEEEAIGYLEKATKAKRYCCYQFPHFNLGRIYLKRKMYGRARAEFEKSLQYDPGYLPALEGLELLRELGIKES
jgi:tetratricopeptide (TPR) repeat protein